MSRFAILLGGDLTVTPRLRAQLKGARFIAADSGMMHAASLGIVPELWVGDFDSAGSELTMQYRDVPRETFPAETFKIPAWAILTDIMEYTNNSLIVGAQ